ncbi:hypothetical protein RchiOBHm_Chr3g0495011 [Rosa chinensis]|uniref:Uncharacterized protein n=1 Tax=Rosa chinensis TaxID=74649 RepID=A0A2P6RH44_ROSCH|nr:protein PHYTOCHROME KINASE SUBSTRATE 4 [Rosa chinensis]PRQ45748.1 hypothetical protein RchiOBHm_Chr3g0495011 [Rosa chinensis]
MERSKGVSSGSSSNSNSNSNSISQKECILGDRNVSFSAYRRPDHEKDGLAAGDDSTEISIFEAQKYFNESIIDAHKVSNNNNNGAININNRAISSPLANNVSIDNMEQPSRFSWAASSSVHDEYSSINMARNNYRARSFHAAATPTASSEASWNSQTGLLSHPPGKVAVSLRSPTHHHHQHHHDHKKSRGMAALPSSSSSPRVRWFSFPRRCPCSGKKSVRVEDRMSSQQPAKTSSSHYTAAAAAAPRIVSLDLRNQTPKSKSVVAASGDQHLMWDEEHRRRWEGQMTVKIPSAGNPHNRLFRPLPAAAEMQAQHTNAFSFPVLKLNGRGTSWSSSSPMLKLQQQPATVKQEPTLGREGHLEPLTTSTDEQSSTTISIHKPATTSTDHSSTGFTFPASPKSRVIISNDDDLGSDASSDLFEIESFSTSTQTTATANNYPSVLYQYNNYRRDSMEDDASSFNAIRGLYRRRSSLDNEPMTTSSAEYCYEPSEASIDWSVTTAEGLDRPSTSSEADYHQDELEKMSRRRPSSVGSYGLLSCRWEKAVSVGPNPVRLVSSMPAGAVGEVMKHVGSRPPLPYKPRCSHLSIPSATSFHS